MSRGAPTQRRAKGNLRQGPSCHSRSVASRSVILAPARLSSPGGPRRLAGGFILRLWLHPILATKLYPPPPPLKVLARPRLIARLNEGLPRKLTLIAAPVGFGKTTLASAWVAGTGMQAAWLSLDAADSDPTRFS